MKNHSRVLSWQSLENIDLLKFIRKFWKKCVFNHKIWANSEIRTFALPKSGGGGGTNPLVPPLLKVGRHVSPLPPPPPLLLRPCESIENAYLRLNKGCWRDKFVIRSVTDVLRTQSRFVKCVGGSACGLTPPPPPQILQTYFRPEVRQ